MLCYRNSGKLFNLLEGFVSIHRSSSTGRFSIRGFDEEEAALQVSGELHLDETLREFPSSLTVFGYRSDHLAMMKHIGALVQVDLNGEHDDRISRSYIARVHDAGWSSGASSKQLAKIATLSIEKAVEEFASSPDRGLGFCSYSYASDVSSWPTAGAFGTSYEGTIELRRFRRGLNSVARGKSFEVDAAPHYFFVRDGRKLIRQQVASITVRWFSPEVDWKRLADCARVVLSFTHVVKLRPLAKVQICDGTYRKVNWAVSDISQVERDRFSGPVDIGNQKAFHARAVRKLYKSEISIEDLDNVIDRYVECRVDTTLERSFAHGCEAIEGLYGLLNARRPARGNANFGPLKKTIKKVINEHVDDHEIKSIASSRVDQLFSRPTWQRIVETISAIAPKDDDLIGRVTSRANFFRYRNLAAHGRVVRLENEVVFQASLMRFVLEWMFIKLCGGKQRPTTGREIATDIDKPGSPDVGLIKLWE